MDSRSDFCITGCEWGCKNGIIVEIEAYPGDNLARLYKHHARQTRQPDLLPKLYRQVEDNQKAM